MSTEKQQKADFELAVSLDGASFSARGSQSVVLDAYTDFKELIKGSAPPAGASKPVKPASSTPARLMSNKNTLPLKPFLAKLKVKSNKEKVAAILAWCAESGEESAQTPGGIKALWKKTPYKMPGNLTRDIAAAETEGWLHREGKSGSANATYSINGYGEGVVAGWAESTE